MHPSIGICGTTTRAEPLCEADNKPLPAQGGTHSITGPLAHLRRLIPISARTLIFLIASASVDLHAADAPVRIGGATYLGDAPTVIADQRDLFTANGIPARVDYSVAGKRNLERLRAGELDFALMALTPLMLDRLSDPTPSAEDDPVILASVMHATHINDVLVPADGPIDEPADLEGRTLGLSRDTSAEFLWWLFTRYHRLDPDGIDIIDAPANEIADALASGAVDAAVLWAPWEARLEFRTGRQFRGFSGVDTYSARWVLVTRRGVSRGQPERCRAILAAYRDAIGFIQQHSERAMQLYAEHTGIDPQYLDGSWDPLIYDLNLDWTVVTTLQQQLEWAHRRTPMQNASGGILSLLAPGPLRELLPDSVSIPDPASEEPAR